ncbi:MAG: DNA internalization-related competence protein ComEC/Rec2 [Clostridiaceae bacterium]|nr:DNA internalization-related competence protein ComEC/Rec2 [Clostridiaceae bacterium]
MKRPLMISAIALIWGILLCDTNISQTWGIILLLLSLVCFILLYRPLRKTHSRFLLLAIPFLLAGYTMHSFNKAYYQDLFLPFTEKEVTIKGRIIDEPVLKKGRVRFTLKPDSIDSVPSKKGLIQVSVYATRSVNKLDYGSLLEISGQIKVPQGKRNIGGFDYQKYLASRGISGVLNISEKSLMVLDGKETFWLKSAGYKFRKLILKGLEQCLPSDEASVLSGMIIGYTSEMPDEMEESFRKIGLSHILVVSGANLAFVIIPLIWFLKRIGFSPRCASAITIPFMILFVLATGMEISVLRAAVMAGIMLIGQVFWRKSDVYCSLAVASIIILFINTYMLFDLGFILSFSATLSLTIFYNTILKQIPELIPKTVRDTFSGTISAQLGVIPIIAYNFNTVSIASVFSNILVVPITGLLTVLGILISIIGNVLLPFGRIIGSFTAIIIRILLFMTKGLSSLSWAEIWIATPPLFLVILYYLFLMYLMFCHPKLPQNIARPLMSGVLIFIGTTIILANTPSRSLRLYFADVGHGDCILIRSPKGKNIIIDGGGSTNDGESSYTGEKIVVPLIYDLKMHKIDLMIATHGHADHINGLKSVMERVPVKNLVVSDTHDDGMKELIELARNKGTFVKRVKEDDIIFSEENLSMTVIYPLEEEYKMTGVKAAGTNEMSLVVRLDYDEFSALFTGDIGFNTEELIINDGVVVECDLLKVAHHGSKYSTSDNFLNHANPVLAVISSGKNIYGHPNPETLKRIENRGIRCFQTVNDGGIFVNVNKGGRKMLVTTVINK